MQNKNKLSYALAPRHVSMIAFGGVIGAGLFVGSSAVISQAGPAVLISYMLAGLVAMFIMRMLGEMAIAKPGMGSFIEYIRLHLGDAAGYISGWLYWFFWIIVVAFEAIIGTSIIQAWLPLPSWVLNLSLIVILTLTNLASVRAFGEFEFWFASLKVLAIFLFGLVCLAWMFGLFGADAAKTTMFSFDGFIPQGSWAILAVIPAVLFSFVGSEVATVAAAESQEPAKNVARAAKSVVLRIMVFYIGAVFLILCILPWSDVVAGQSPFVAVMELMQVPYAGFIMTLVILTAVLSCLNSGIYVTSRILFELSTRQEAPKILAKLNTKHVPTISILVCASVAFLVTVLSTTGSDAVFTFLLNASGVLVLFIYLLIVAAHIALRRKVLAGIHPALSFKMWAYPLLSYLSIVFIAAVLLAMALSPKDQIQVACSTVLLVLISLSYLVYGRFLKNKNNAIKVIG